MTDLIIIGGGAAGMAAGILAARAGLTVTILERNRQFGKKLSVTGNGKCNFTNAYQTPERYRSDNSELAWRVLEDFPVSATLAFFRSLGLEYYEKNGYYYPLSDSAADVVKVMIDELAVLRVKCKTNIHVHKITKQEDRFFVHTEGYSYEASHVLLAAGGLAAPQHGTEGYGFHLAQELGHTLIPTVPSLTALKFEHDPITTLAGLRWQGTINLEVFEKTSINNELSDPNMKYSDSGELQFTTYGISGIPAMQVSRFGARALAEGNKVQVVLDFFPDVCLNQLQIKIKDRLHTRQGRSVKEWFAGWLPEKLATLVLSKLSISFNTPVEDILDKDWQRIATLLKSYSLLLEGVRSFDAAQTTAGGVSLTECNEYLESKIMPGLFFAGEVLDVDGACGGYNLQWAWASAAKVIEGIIEQEKL